jgi:NACalpha-BTF3-like transcription factor
MSRHRNVRRLVKEQQFYDDDEEDDDYDDKDYEHEEYYNSDAQQDEQYNDEDEEEELDVKVASLLSMLPKDTRCSREQAQNALLKNHMDVEKAMRSLKPSLLPPKHPAKSGKFNFHFELRKFEQMEWPASHPDIKKPKIPQNSRLVRLVKWPQLPLYQIQVSCQVLDRLRL